MKRTRFICKHCGACACDECQKGGKCRACGKTGVVKQTLTKKGWADKEAD